MKIQDYMKLPYTKIIKEVNDESGNYYYGKILELDGCQSTGDTIEEVYENLKEAMEGYLEVKIENNLPISLPLPDDETGYSGKFVIRIPKSLHQRLAIEAKKEDVSLNQYVAYKLAK